MMIMCLVESLLMVNHLRKKATPGRSHALLNFQIQLCLRPGRCVTARTGDRRALLLSISLSSYLLLCRPSHSLCLALIFELGGSTIPSSAAGGLCLRRSSGWWRVEGDVWLTFSGVRSSLAPSCRWVSGVWRSICLFRPWCLGGTRSAIPRLDCSRDIDFLRGEFNSLAVNVVLGLVALARGVLLSRGVEIVVHGSFEAASSPSVHPFSSSGLVFFSGSVPPVQLLMSRLTYLRFSEKASDEESELFLVTGVLELFGPLAATIPFPSSCKFGSVFRRSMNPFGGVFGRCRRSLDANYSGDCTDIPGVRVNEENLT
ncbi:hypothetical protein F2Q69_00021432 [Brassica cretica]|uniref:Uncharacterized protein n=1 Tax=Brassica cretica TaxID=69181 RepID=A0A8S9Q1Y4_BRACR|nr:hypothetical protein F2Q69_00021432 [Brassica cretica]